MESERGLEIVGVVIATGSATLFCEGHSTLGRWNTFLIKPYKSCFVVILSWIGFKMVNRDPPSFDTFVMMGSGANIYREK